MEHTLTNDKLISYHRQQDNPVPYMPNILTFAYEGGKFGKQGNLLTPQTSSTTSSNAVTTSCARRF